MTVNDMIAPSEISEKEQLLTLGVQTNKVGDVCSGEGAKLVTLSCRDDI
jgi:hypothetical protein